jgi:hypothetical protein
MNIVYENDARILIKNNGDKINISDGTIIQYIANYYKLINIITRYATIETIFVGKIVCEKSRYDTGIIGIYIQPIYIWDNLNNEWLKINDYTVPKTKYFLYPHFLALPRLSDSSYSPLYFLDTITNKNLDDYNSIEKTFSLH